MMRHYQYLSSQLATAFVVCAAIGASPVIAQTTSAIEVQVNSTSTGLAIRLEPGTGVSTTAPTITGNTVTFEVLNAQLKSGTPFRQDNPGAGIASIIVSPIDATRLRIEITGTITAPTVEVSQQNQAIVVSVPTLVAEEDEEEVVVVGNRRPTLRSQTPAAVEVKTEAELQRERPLARSIVDNLQTVPGITVNRLGLLTGSLNIRGLTGERIGLLVDGERLPNRQFGPNFSTIDPFRVERIEVLKGPASSIYGADAFGGVVNVITTTPRPDRPFRVRTQLFGGGAAELTTNLEVQAPNIIVGGSFSTAGDARDGKGNLIPLGTSYQSTSGYASGRIDLSRLDRLELRLDRTSQYDVDLAGFATPPESPFQITSAQNAYQNRDRYSLAYINEGVPGGTSFAVRGYYQRFEDQTDLNNLLTIPGRTIGRGPFLPPIVVPAIQIPGASSSRGLTETFGFSAQANSSIGDAILTYGYDFSRDRGSSFDLLNNQRGVLGTRTFNGVFVQSAYTVIPNLTLAAGLRFDAFDSEADNNQERNDSAVTFNVGSIYRLTDALALRANFAQGFRPPTLQLLFGSNADGSFFAPTRGAIVANPDLNPERANNFDIGFEYQTRDVSARLGYFYNNISDFLGFNPIVPRQTTAGFATLETANKNVILQGVEFSASYQFTRGWFLDGNLTYVSGRDTSGARLSQLEVFPFTALVRLRYDNGRFNSFLQSRIYGGQGTVLLANNVEGEGSPAATVFDFQIGYRATRSTELTLTIENLFNADYVFPTVNIAAPGIRVLAGIRADF
ncbi:TonB-dependent receptor domain-containing protein [Leptolyngbya sp. AN03gr2]|uniref:TonB-dependent receptor domain-containing protein n=1 Tax=unclassified Leptolyngbya TaxID=2650499 RepID=UPI003D3224A2